MRSISLSLRNGGYSGNRIVFFVNIPARENGSTATVIVCLVAAGFASPTFRMSERGLQVCSRMPFHITSNQQTIGGRNMNATSKKWDFQWRGLRLRSLKARVLFLFVIILVLQLGLSSFAISYSKQTIQQEEINKTSSLLQSKIQLIGEEFEKIGVVSKLANSSYEKKLEELRGYPDDLVNQLFESKYRMSNGLYALDEYVAKTKADIGNARIEKGPLTVEQKRQILASESFDGLFATIKKTIPESQWYYFTTVHKFQKIYPFVDNKEGAYTTDKSMANEFFQIAVPENNPSREIKWTKPYKDELGTGMMVTASIPIYAQDKFQGVFSIDISLTGVADIANSLSLADGMHAMVVDSYQNILTGAVKQVETNEQNTLETDIEDPAMKAWMVKVLNEQKDSDLYTDQDDLVFANKIEETGWYLFLWVPVKNIEKLSDQQVMLISLIIFMFIVGIVIVFAYISKRLNVLSDVRDRLVAIASGGGDLTGRIQVSGSDEIRQLADAFNEYLNQLEKMIADIKRSATTVVDYSIQLEENIASSTEYIEGINRKTNDVSNESTNISAVAQELSAAVEEIAATTRDNLSTLGHLVNEITQIKNLSENSEGVANKALAGMDNIEVEVKKSVDIAKQLEDSMKRISDIVTTMTSISTQTNLLALNASIEAARAGEAGKGFSVVAEEVRKLAEESKNSSDNIHGIIGELQNSLSETIHTLSKQSEIILREKQNVMSLIEHMKEIKTSIESSTEQIKTFEANVDAQADGTDASSQNLGQVTESITEMTAALMTISSNIQNQTEIQSDMRQIAGQMKATSEQLNELVKKFVVRGDAGKEEQSA
ncbi:methyl-accepting chemotaxis protein [Brevibacillus sp. MCWH]|nr:methyl-accepting chemotaxis protein [Brevibacillus sp. MCWH]